MRSKRFRLVSEQRKTAEEWDFLVLAARKMERGPPRPFTRAIFRASGFRLSFLVICSETERKRLLHKLIGSLSNHDDDHNDDFKKQ